MILTGSFEGGCPLLLLQFEGDSRPRRAVLDTGFNGELAVPREVAVAMGWKAVGVLEYQSASGTASALLMEGRISWFGQIRRVAAMTHAAGVVLVGMELLHDCRVRIHREAGKVEVERAG